MLHALSDGLPDVPFGKTLREVYVNMMSHGGAEDWKHFTRLLSLSSAHELQTRIEAAMTTLRDADLIGNASSISTSLILFSEQLRRLGESQFTEKSPNSKDQAIFVPQGNKKLDKFELKAVPKFSF